MADNFLERHRDDYEKRKAEWLKRKSHLHKISAAAVCKKRMTREMDE